MFRGLVPLPLGSGSVMVHGTDSFQVPGAPALPLLDKDKRTELRYAYVRRGVAGWCFFPRTFELAL